MPLYGMVIVFETATVLAPVAVMPTKVSCHMPGCSGTANTNVPSALAVVDAVVKASPAGAVAPGAGEGGIEAPGARGAPSFVDVRTTEVTRLPILVTATVPAASAAPAAGVTNATVGT